MTLPMFDADQHYYEPDDAFTRYLPKRFIEANRAVRVIRTKDQPQGRLLPALGALVSAFARALHLGRSFGVVAVTGTDGSGRLRVTATVSRRRHVA
jgi:hypothetical protein